MSTYISVELQRQIRARFRNCCAYCQTTEALTVTVFEYEHIVPRSAGGETVFSNLCLACPSCNRYKAARQTAFDKMSEREVALFNPHSQQWTEHFGWNEDSTEILGLTGTGRVTVTQLKMNRPQMIRVRKLWVRMGEHPPSFLLRDLIEMKLQELGEENFRQRCNSIALSIHELERAKQGNIGGIDFLIATLLGMTSEEVLDAAIAQLKQQS